MTNAYKIICTLLVLYTLSFTSNAQLNVSSFYQSTMGSVQASVQYNNKIYILSNGLWEYDGHLAPKLLTSNMYGKSLIEYNNKLYAKGGAGNDAELWCYDLATSTTYLVADINPGINGSAPQDFFIFKNNLYFNAYDGSGFKRYRYNGTSAPVYVSSICLASDLHILSDRFTFLYDGYIYSSDGYGDPVMVNTATAGMVLGTSVVFNDNLYFKIGDSVSGFDLYKYDGSGTLPAKKILLTGRLSRNEPVFTIAFNKLFFAGNIPSGGIEICALTTTDQISYFDINPGTASSTPNYMEFVDNTLYISASTTAFGYELWKYTGVGAPVMVDDMNTGAANSSPDNVFMYQDSIFFRSTTPTGTFLYAYDKLNAPVKKFNLFYNSILNNILLLTNSGKTLFEYDGLPNATISLSNVTRTYGDGPFTVQTSSNSAAPYYFKIISGTSITIDSASGQSTIITAGTSSVKVMQMRSATYTKSSALADIQINKAPLTISVPNQIIEKGTVALCKYTIVGWLLNDDESLLPYPIACDFNNVGNSVGTYPYRLYNNKGPSNYSVTYQAATITVTDPLPNGTINMINNNLALYPNPSDGLLQGPADFIDIHIRLTSIGGQTEEYNSFPVQTTMKGLTLVEIEADGKIFKGKIIFQ